MSARQTCNRCHVAVSEDLRRFADFLSFLDLGRQGGSTNRFPPRGFQQGACKGVPQDFHPRIFMKGASNTRGFHQEGSTKDRPSCVHFDAANFDLQHFLFGFLLLSKHGPLAPLENFWGSSIFFVGVFRSGWPSWGRCDDIFRNSWGSRQSCRISFSHVLGNNLYILFWENSKHSIRQNSDDALGNVCRKKLDEYHVVCLFVWGQVLQLPFLTIFLMRRLNNVKT